MAAAPTKASPKRGKSRQRRMGPAPFASFEDLSDELESPDEAKRALLPGIKEDSTTHEEPGVNLLGLYTPSTPRIDISRASSSSQHEESGGSSGGGGTGSPEGRDPLAVAAGLATGFKEEGTADLRSSTEELDYHGSEQEVPQRRRAMHKQQQERRSADGVSSPLLQSGGFRYDADEERKDSEGALLLGVAGRTSRISSVGSAGSGASAASALSGLSAGSAISGAPSSSGMRSPSPHKMLLETSFCGSKPIPTKSMEIEDSEAKSDPNITEKTNDSQKERHQEKPDTLDLIPKTEKVPQVNGVKEITSSSSSHSVMRQASATVTGSKSVSSTPSASPKLSRHSLLKKSEESASPVAEEETPSPATSRKSSFTGLFGRRSESGNLLSPESPTVGPVAQKQRGNKGAISAAIGGLRERSRSRSKSREHIEQTGLTIAQNNAIPGAGASSESKAKKDSRNKGVFSSFFKKKDKSKKSKSGSSSGAPSIGDTASEGDPLSPDAVSPDAIDADIKIMEDAIGNVEFTFSDDISYQCSEEAKLDDGISKLVRSASDERANFGDEVFIQKIVSIPIREEEECMKPDIPEEVSEVHSVEAEHHSSESEREVEYLHAKEQLKEGLEIQEVDHERKGLVLQQDSFEDELPYIPTTLPQERSVALPIKPVRQRNLAEMRTCPIERPRSTTPINPCALEEFLVAASSTVKSSSQDERLRISLPREDSIPAETLPPQSKSPRSTLGSAAFCSWVQFNEDASGSLKEGRKQRMCETPGDDECGSSSPPPPLPPRGSLSNQWVNFEEIPEKRKTPKKLREVSKNVELGHMKGSHSQRMVYSYVNPEDCKCECHEMSRPGVVEEREKNGGTKNQLSIVSQVIDDRPPAESRKDSIVSVGEVARLEVDNLGDRHSYQSDSSCEFPTNCSVDQQDLEISDGLLKPMKPFGMDLDISSNRSSIISQDEPASPDNGSSNQKELLHH